MFSLLRIVHVLGGAVALIALVPILLGRKGGRFHRRAGRVFVEAMGVAGSTGLVISAAWIIDPARFTDGDLEARRAAGMFLGMVGLLTIASMRAGVRALAKTGARKSDLLVYVALIVASVVTFAVSAPAGRTLPAVFSVVGAINGVGALRFALKPSTSRAAKIIEHVGAMGGAAIAATTAFVVFGAARFLGDAGLVAWLAPTVIGTPLIVRETIRRKSALKRVSPAGTVA